MGKGHRQGRLGEEIRKIVSQMLLREIKDPGLRDKMLSISAVDVTRDNSYATVYISVLGAGKGAIADDEEKKEILDAFARAKGLIRREVAKSLTLRHVPELLFKIDSSMEYGAHMSEMIDSLGIEHYKAEESVPAKRDVDADIDDILKDLQPCRK